MSYESSNGLIAISYGNSQVGGYSQESKLIILASASKADSKAIGWIVDGKVSVKTPAGDDLTYVQLTNPPSGWATAKSLKAELMYDDDGIDPVSVAIVGLTAVVGIAAVALVVGKN